jgi:hypothetical protein
MLHSSRHHASSSPRCPTTPVLPLLAALLSFHSSASALDNGLAMTPYDCSRMIHTHACPAAPWPLALMDRTRILLPTAQAHGVDDLGAFPLYGWRERDWSELCRGPDELHFRAAREAGDDTPEADMMMPPVCCATTDRRRPHREHLSIVLLAPVAARGYPGATRVVLARIPLCEVRPPVPLTMSLCAAAGREAHCPHTALCVHTASTTAGKTGTARLTASSGPTLHAFHTG